MESRGARRGVPGASAAGRLPILLGGDHSLSIGSISAVARHCREAQRPAASDLARCARRFQYPRTQSERQSARHAGRVFVRLRAGELAADRRSAAGHPTAWVRQVGIRSVDPGERRFVHEQQLAVFDMRYIDEMGVRHAMELALAGFARRTRTCTSVSMSIFSTRRSHRASAPRSPAECPTAKRSCAWR